MTTLSEAVETLYQTFLSEWGSKTLVILDNEKAPALPAEWVRVSVRHTASTQSTLGAPGNRRFRRRASLFAQIFVPVDRGTKRAHELAQAAREIFEGKTFGNIGFFDCIVRELGVDGKWYQINLEAIFEYDEVR